MRIQLRLLAKNWPFTLAAAISLALGLGVNATVFGLVDAVFWKPLPVREPSRLVFIYTQAGTGFTSTSYADFEDLAKLPAFASGAVFSRIATRMRNGQETERVSTEVVSADYFDVAGIAPALGRFLEASDHRADAEPAVVVGYALWDRLFQKDRQVLGRRIALNDRVFSIVGVTPRGYRSPVLDWGQPPEAWISLSQASAVEPGLRRYDLHGKRDLRWMLMIARLAPGASLANAQAAVDVAGRSLAKEYPQTNGQQSFRVMSSNQGRFWPGRRDESIRFAMLLGAVAIAVLLIACCNLSSTLIARTMAREKEIGVRLAIGAGKARIVRESLMESFLLALLGCGLSIPVSIGLSNGLRAFPAPFLVPISVDTSIDWRTAAFLAAASMAMAFVAGATSAWKAAGNEISLVLKGAAPSGALARHAFLVAQVAVSFVLLIGAGLLAKSLAGLQHADLGYRVDGITVARVELTPEQGAQQERELLAAAAAIPGVDHAAIAWEILPTMIRNPRQVRAIDSGVELPVERLNVSAGYFQTLGMRIVDGRDFRAEEAHPVVIINQDSARRFWKGESAIGKRLHLEGAPEDREVVGVVSDAKYHEVDEAPAPFLFVLTSQSIASREPVVLVHSSQGTLPGAALRREISKDPALLVTLAEPLDEYVAARLSQPRLAAFLAGGVALIGLILSAIGLHSILVYFVTRQLREIGIRVAIGATRIDVVALIARRGMLLGLAGLAVGLFGALWGMQLVRSQLHGVAVSDPWIYLTASAIFLIVIAIASIGPALRALRIDPASLLRSM
jgi:predicted permease